MQTRCSLCNSFKRAPRDYRVGFDCDIFALERSADAGCPFCSLFRNGIAKFEGKVGNLASSPHTIYVSGADIDGKTGMVVDVYVRGTRHLALEFFVGSSTRAERLQFTDIKTLPTIPGDTSSKTSIAWALRLLQNCGDGHLACRRNTVPKLPTRVLDLGPGTQGSEVRLMESRGASGEYVCLSHCWGNIRSIVAERENISQLYDGISWDSLPKTFQDAITIVRMLGLQYLWIDSLCIIQNDREDWRRESARMASIYQNSYVTIAATKSSDDTGGCFSDKSPYFLDYQVDCGKAPPWGKQSHSLEFYVREKILHFEDCQSLTPLDSRGWAYQERLLAPRILYFCQKELVWECQEFVGCQCTEYKPRTRLKQAYFAAVGGNSQKSDADDTGPTHVENGSLHKHSQTRPKLIERSYSSGNDHSVATMMTSPSRPSLQRRALTIPKDGLQVLLSSWSKVSGKAPATTALGSAKPARFPEGQIGQPSRQLVKSGPERMTYFQALAELETTRGKLGAFGNPLISIWHRIVSDYCGLNLSVHSDRLPAIAGVASQITKSSRGRYLAGLWEEALLPDLLWHVDEPMDARTQQQPRAYRAPSWSWASVDGKVAFLTDGLIRDRSAFDVSDVECSPVSDVDQYGEVRSSKLKGWVDLSPAQILWDDLERRPPTSRLVKIAVAGEIASFIADSDIRPHHRHDPARNLENVYCVGQFMTNDLTASLVLRHIDGKDVFERIGICIRRQSSSFAKVPATVTSTELGVDRRHCITLI